MNKKQLPTIGLLTIWCACTMSAVASPVMPLRIANVIIPASFASALRDGLSVPVQLRYQDADAGTDTLTRDPVGSATLVLKGHSIYLLSVDFSAGKGQGLLNDDLIAKLAVDDDRPFDKAGLLQIDKDATMQLDLVTMLMTLEVSRAAFSLEKPIVKDESLAPSTHQLTSMNRYNFGYSFSNGDAGYLDSNYLQLGSTVGLGANHLLLDGSLYNLGKEGQDGQLYRAMYERDLDNRRLAAGMVSTWDLQTLGLVSALNTSRIYGASYGNQAFSRQSNTADSTTPVQVFMPADGEARVYRDGRMLAVVNLPIGNQTLDTSNYPNGVYDVRVEAYVDGRLVSTNTQRVTKLGGNNQFTDSWGWQAWGGWMETSMETQTDSPVLGVSLSRTYGAVAFSGSSYAFNEASVGEIGLQWQPMDNMSLGAQTMLSSEGSYRVGSNINMQLLDNLSLWASQEKLVSGDRLNLSNSDQISLGTSLNLGEWVSALGQLSTSANFDRLRNSKRSYIDYSQNLYSGTLGTLSLRGSLQSDGVNFGHFDNKSIMLDYTLPLGNMFSLGMSSNEQGQTTANLGYHTYLDGVINQVNLNAQRTLNGDSNSSPALSGSLGYDHQLVTGAMSLTRNSQGDINGNLTARGALGTTQEGLTLTGQGDHSAGLLIKTDTGADSRLQAKVNGIDYSLQGNKTLIALSPYQKYEVELMNSKNSVDSYEINSGKQSYTLFPGNVATLDVSQSIREMVTVFGVIRAEDGTLLTNARIDNHIGTTLTNEAGEFSLDVDKANPMLMFKHGSDYCEAELDIRNESGAAWVGDIICHGLTSYARN
ncbi:CS1-pili formation C-terminal domain-containing protein [Aeromonas sp. 604176]|uniref:CS1-pili formation C-terminal domain-containing protein n=1 Tax=Aeromonas sp. 604176 TaxID=2712052 RepID=UPI003BA3C389